MSLYTDDRPHPLGLTNNPEWDLALTKRAELYIAERARRPHLNNPEPTGTGLGGFVIAILAVVAVALSAIAGVVG